MSLSLVAVFIPFMFAGGIVGKIFREFTVTLSVSILISLVISLTTTPMMCSLLLERDSKRKPSRFGDAFERGFGKLRRGYERTLDWALHRPRTMLLLLCITVGLNIYLYVVIPKGFFPQQDTGQLQGGIRGDAQSSFQFMKRKLQQVAAIIQADPAVNTVTGSVGGGGFGPFGGGGANANVTIALKPLAERRISADQIIARLRPKLNAVTGVATFLQAVQDIGGGGGRSANSQYQYTLLGDDLAELRTWSQKLRTALQDMPEITDVDTDMQPGGLEADLIVDRDSASRLGLTEIQIDNALGDAFAQAQVSNIYNPFSPQQYHVVMEVAPEFWQNPEVLKELYVSTSGGAVSGTQSTQAVAGTTALHIGRRRHAVQHRRGGGRGAQSGGEFAGQCGARQYLDRLGREHRRRNPGAVCGIQPLQHRHDAGERESYGHFRIDGHRVQSAHRRDAGYGARRDQPQDERQSMCPSASSAEPTERPACFSRAAATRR